MHSRPMHIFGFSLFITALALGFNSVAHADDPAEIELQRKLDAPFDLDLDSQPLKDAFADIQKKGKINLVVDDASYAALPYGNTTKVTATFHQTKLRQAIDEILLPLGLEQQVSANNIIIQPTPALARIGQRATWEELQLLQAIRTTERPPGGDFDWNTDFRTLLGKPSMAVKFQGADNGNNEAALGKVRVQLPATLAALLDTYCNSTNQIWTVDGADVLIMPMEKWIARQLDRPIVIHSNNVPLEAIVSDISHLSGIRFTPEPGLYKAFPMVTLNSNYATVQQTLDALSGFTGIVAKMQEDHIILQLGNSATVPNSNSKGDQIIGRIGVPIGENGLVFDLLVRESDLPPDLDDTRKKKLAEALNGLQKALQSSATQPGTATTNPAPGQK